MHDDACHAGPLPCGHFGRRRFMVLRVGVAPDPTTSPHQWTMAKSGKVSRQQSLQCGRSTPPARTSSSRSRPSRSAARSTAVYASLWNLRAVAERSFARRDQASVAMGLAIVAAYDVEADMAASAVLVTRVLTTDAVYGYSLSVQGGNNLVTNPDPGTHSETAIAALISDVEPIAFTITRYARQGWPRAHGARAHPRAAGPARRDHADGRAGLLPSEARLLRAGLQGGLRRHHQAQGPGSGGQGPGDESAGGQASPRVRRGLWRATRSRWRSGRRRPGCGDGGRRGVVDGAFRGGGRGGRIRTPVR